MKTSPSGRGSSDKGGEHLSLQRVGTHAERAGNHTALLTGQNQSVSKGSVERFKHPTAVRVTVLPTEGLTAFL